MLDFAKILFLVLTVYSINGYSQDESYWSGHIKDDILKLNLNKFDNDNYDKVYRIWKSYQVIELVRQNDSIFTGKLVNFVTKTHRKSEKNKLLKEILKIPPITVKKLFDNLSETEIENLPDGETIDGYATGFDGTTYIFEIKTKNSERIYSYWEPMNDYYQNDSIKEVKLVRAILTNLITEINPDLHFKNFTNNLDYGNYEYGGIRMKKIKNVW